MGTGEILFLVLVLAAAGGLRGDARLLFARLMPASCRSQGELIEGLEPALGCDRETHPRRAMTSPYDTDLGKTRANYQPLTPLVFLERAASTFPDHAAIIHGKRRYLLRRVLCPLAAGSPRRLPPAASARTTPSR